MDFRQYLALLRRWWWLLAISVLAGGAVAYGVSTLITPTYRATATLLVAQQQTPGVVLLNDLQASERLANTFSRLVTLRPVLERASVDSQLEIDADALNGIVSVHNPRSTQLLEVSASTDDPQLASDIANAVADAFIASNEAELSARPGTVSIVEAALAPLAPVAPRKPLNAVVGALLGLLIAAGVIVLVEYLDDTVSTEQEVTELTGLATIGRVEHFGKVQSPTEQLQAANRPRSSTAEAYRSMRTNLAYSLDLGRGGRLMMVASPGPGEGKTTTISNLAVVFGLTGRRVVLVDTDLRRPMVHRVFGLRNSMGLTNLLLSSDPDVTQAVQRTAYHNVSVLSAGPIPPNPSELLGSARTSLILDQLRAQFDVVLLDSPPVLVVTDASVLANYSDGIVIVMRPGRTRSGALRATAQTLTQSGRPMLGVVFNQVKSGGSSYYYYGGSGRRGYYRSDEETDEAGEEDGSPGDVLRLNGITGAERADDGTPAVVAGPTADTGDDQPPSAQGQV